ncbi:hypothetical protein niasHT_003131 [Heterodera trifolii]|uniref:Uncharacterized protein n=1 Tax=Heterodera trifolii TaxID=157864 RepID=A0ABD2M4Z0_9BILA
MKKSWSNLLGGDGGERRERKRKKGGARTDRITRLKPMTTKSMNDSPSMGASGRLNAELSALRACLAVLRRPRPRMRMKRRRTKRWRTKRWRTKRRRRTIALAELEVKSEARAMVTMRKEKGAGGVVGVFALPWRRSSNLLRLRCETRKMIWKRVRANGEATNDRGENETRRKMNRSLFNFCFIISQQS